MRKNNTLLQEINRVNAGNLGQNWEENLGAEFGENPRVVAVRAVAFVLRQNVNDEDRSCFLSSPFVQPPCAMDA